MRFILIVGAILINFNLLAQVFPEDTIKLEEVVITYSKLPTPARHTSKVMEVISKRDLENSTSRNLAQVLQSQAGMVVTGSYSNLGEPKSMRLRGLGSQYTLILVDGMALNDPSLSGANFDIRTLSIDNIERIEILKGNQSTLYGTDAIAGVVNIITTKTKANQAFSPSFQISGGSFGTLKTHANLNGSKEAVDYQVSFNYDQSNGISSAKDTAGNQNFNNDGLERIGGQVKIGVQFNEVIRFEPFLRYTDFRGDYDGGAFRDGNNNYKIKVINTGFKTDFDLQNMPIVFNYAFTDTDREFNSTFGSISSIFPYKAKLHNVDLFSNYKLLDAKVQALYGVNIQNNRGSNLGDTTTISEDVTISAAYLKFLLQDLSGLYFEAGGRFNNHSLYGSNAVYNTAVAYRYKSHKLFATYATGFKAPTLFELSSNSGNKALKPQRSTNLEVGWESYFFDGRLKLQTAYFKTEIKDLIIFGLVGNRIQFINQNEQLSEGLEVALDYKTSDFYLKANYNLLFLNLESRSNVRLPEHNLNVNLGYQKSRWNLNLETQYLTERFDLAFNPDFTTRNVKLDAYFLVNLHWAYKLDERLNLFVDVQNLTGQEFTEIYGYNTLPLSLYGGIRLSF